MYFIPLEALQDQDRQDSTIEFLYAQIPSYYDHNNEEEEKETTENSGVIIIEI
jgi:hypothetical protein